MPGHEAHKYCHFPARKRPLRVATWLTFRDFKTKLSSYRTHQQRSLRAKVASQADQRFPRAFIPLVLKSSHCSLCQMLFNKLLVAMVLQWLMACSVGIICSASQIPLKTEGVKGSTSYALSWWLERMKHVHVAHLYLIVER